jgi:hypothetical protein
MSTFISLHSARNKFQRIGLHHAPKLFPLTLATSGLIFLGNFSQPGLATAIVSPTPEYIPPARETPLRTESAGVRLGEEKGPATVKQNTIATEHLIIYRPAIAPILNWLQVLLPTSLPKDLFKTDKTPKSTPKA